MTTKTGAWSDSRDIYTQSEVEAVLNGLGIDVREDTANDFLSFCPYHGNSDSPAFSTSKRYGYSICFNPACAKGQDKRLTLEGLVSDLKGLDRIAAKRFIMQHKQNDGKSFEEKWDSIEEEPEELAEFPAKAIEVMHERFMQTSYAVEYIKSRGITRETAEFFKIGFTPASSGPVYRKQDMVVVPAYDFKARPVGLVGRSIVGKEFKNFGPKPDGTGFHKSKIIYNLHNAKRHDTIILTEATFDAQRVHQSGYPNVGALLGGSLSTAQRDMLRRYFKHIIIMTDNENEANGEMTFHRHCAKCVREGHGYCQGHKPGRELGMSIADALPGMKISWAMYDDRSVYANDVKDTSAMTDDQIRQCLRNMVGHYEYLDTLA